MNPGTGKESNRLTSFSEISWGAATTLYMASISTINEIDMGHIVTDAVAIGRHSRDESTVGGAVDFNDARANLLDGSDDGSASDNDAVASSVHNGRSPSPAAPSIPGIRIRPPAKHRASPPRASLPPALRRPSSSRPASSVPTASRPAVSRSDHSRPSASHSTAVRRTVGTPASHASSSSSHTASDEEEADVTMTQSQHTSSHRRRAQLKAASSDEDSEVELVDNDDEVEIVEVAQARVAPRKASKASGSKKSNRARGVSPAF